MSIFSHYVGTHLEWQDLRINDESRVRIVVVVQWNVNGSQDNGIESY